MEKEYTITKLNKEAADYQEQIKKLKSETGLKNLNTFDVIDRNTSPNIGQGSNRNSNANNSTNLSYSKHKNSEPNIYKKPDYTDYKNKNNSLLKGDHSGFIDSYQNIDKDFGNINSLFLIIVFRKQK